MIDVRVWEGRDGGRRENEHTSGGRAMACARRWWLSVSLLSSSEEEDASMRRAFWTGSLLSLGGAPARRLRRTVNPNLGDSMMSIARC